MILEDQSGIGIRVRDIQSHRIASRQNESRQNRNRCESESSEQNRCQTNRADESLSVRVAVGIGHCESASLLNPVAVESESLSERVTVGGIAVGIGIAVRVRPSERVTSESESRQSRRVGPNRCQNPSRQSPARSRSRRTVAGSESVRIGIAVSIRVASESESLSDGVAVRIESLSSPSRCQRIRQRIASESESSRCQSPSRVDESLSNGRCQNRIAAVRITVE